MAATKENPGRPTTIERNPGWQPPIELQQGIHALARRWSRDRRDFQEDLEQEALLAIWTRGETEAPLNHQLQTAKHRMLSVRKLGRSVDGKLDYTYHRPRAYLVVSLEQDGTQMGDHTFPFQDILPDPSRVEEHVVAKLTFLEIISFLEPHERRYTLLLCQGFTPQEVAAQVQQPYPAVKQCLAETRRKLRRLTGGAPH